VGIRPKRPNPRSLAGEKVIMDDGTASGRSVGYLDRALTGSWPGHGLVTGADPGHWPPEPARLREVARGHAGSRLRAAAVDSTPRSQTAPPRAPRHLSADQPDMALRPAPHAPAVERFSGGCECVIARVPWLSGVFGSHVARCAQGLRRVEEYKHGPDEPPVAVHWTRHDSEAGQVRRC